MTKDKIIEFIKEQISGLLEKPELKDTLSIHDDLFEVGLDSVMIVNLVVQIEQGIDVFFEDDELMVENFNNIEVIANQIMEKLEIEI